MTNVFEKPSVERLVAGGTYVLFFGLITGLLGWLFIAIASRSDIGIGPDLLGYVTVVSALNGIGYCISGGLHQALSKYLSETLVESKEKALNYAKAGFFIFNTIGIILFAIFLGISLYLFPRNFQYGFIFAVAAFLFFLNFFRDNLVGNLASTHRFDYIGKINFFAGISNFALSCLILFLVPYPLNGLLISAILISNCIFQLIFIFHFWKKIVTYPLSSFLKGARRQEIAPLLKYGLYCIVPNIIFSGAILWIQNLWYSGFFGFAKALVSINGLIIGYASIVFAICQFGWAQIPAVAEAKAMKNYKLIDDYIKNTLHNGFNISAFLLVIYIGLSNHLLYLFHGPEYVLGHIPFIILTIAVGILGIEFLICSLLIGLGEGRKAAYLILVLTLIQIILVPILIIVFNSYFGTESTLFAGPVSLLTSSLVILPFTFRYLLKYTNNPPRIYRNILGKGTVSIILSLLCYFIFDFTILTNIDPIIGLIVRGAILVGFFILFLLIFAGFTDTDLDFYEHNLGPLKVLIPLFRWLLHHSPFFEPEERLSTQKLFK